MTSHEDGTTLKVVETQQNPHKIILGHNWSLDKINLEFKSKWLLNYNIILRKYLSLHLEIYSTQCFNYLRYEQYVHWNTRSNFLFIKKITSNVIPVWNFIIRMFSVYGQWFQLDFSPWWLFQKDPVWPVMKPDRMDNDGNGITENNNCCRWLI